MTDHFPIRIDVEEQHLGPVLKMLNTMKGVATIHLQLQALNSNPSLPAPSASSETKKYVSKPPVKKYVSKPPVKRNTNSNVRDLVAKALSKGAMHSNIIGEILERNGLSKFSVASAITKMVSDKNVVRVGPGTYRLTPQGERLYLSEGGRRPHYRVAGPAGNNKTGLRNLILRSLMGHGLTHQQLSDLFADNGHSRNNMYALVKKMREEGYIRRVADDYTITDAGQTSIAEEPRQEPLHLEHQPQDNANHGEAV